jgi:exo-1,4-beta-D-glucosaminidase
MPRRRLPLLVLFLLSLNAISLLVAEPAPLAAAPISVELLQGWEIQSSCEAKTTGDKVSQTDFTTTGWHKTTIPNTVVGTLVDDKTYPDPVVGTNLKNFPGMNYSNASFFALQDMPEGSPFKCSWWWRNEFVVPESFAKKHIVIHFPGINYRANVWFNGQKIGDSADIVGTYRIFEFDLTKLAKVGAKNVIALETTAPAKEDLGITWVDWNPTPADKDLGIWKEVSLTATGPVAIRNPFVKTQVTVAADLRNDSGEKIDGLLLAEVDGKTVKQPVELAAGETKTVRFESAQFSALKFASPRLWWPYTVGKPNLYKATLRLEVQNQISESTTITFGIKQVTSELTEKGHRLFKINGRKILIRGAAWAPDMFLRPMSKKLDADLRYVKHMGLNTIRLEGRIDRDELFNKTDEMGILVMPGWTCCDAWEI